MKVLLFVSVCGLLNSVAVPRDLGAKTHRHIITVTEIGQENPFPEPTPTEDGEMVAKEMN